MPYVVVHFFKNEIRLGLTENKKLGDKNKFGFYVKFHESMIKPIFKFVDIGQVVSFWIKRHLLS